VLQEQVDDPERYNNEVIFPDKVRLNREYVDSWSFRKDLADGGRVGVGNACRVRDFLPIVLSKDPGTYGVGR